MSKEIFSKQDMIPISILSCRKKKVKTLLLTCSFLELPAYFSVSGEKKNPI